MNKTRHEIRKWLTDWTAEPYAYLTTQGRRTGQPHRIEIWFATDGERMYLMSGGRDQVDWVRNLQANPQVTVELGDATMSGVARIVEEGTAEDRQIRERLVTKYATRDRPLEDWKVQSLPVVIEFPD